MKFFAKELLVDQHNKAINFRLHSLQFPHMRALHLAWISFMVAFMSWYAIPPIVYHIAEDLDISAEEIYDSNMVSVALTIVARLIIGPLCERYGPRRIMCAILVCGAIPCGMTGLIQNGAGLIGIRAVIGILGASFVPCQFWTTQMFSPSVVGTANSISAGWGNMGAGVTYLIMPAIYDGIEARAGNAFAWRVTFVVPAGICLLVAAADYFLATDTPHGDWLEYHKNANNDAGHGGNHEEEQDISSSSSTSISSSMETPEQKMEKGSFRSTPSEKGVPATTLDGKQQQQQDCVEESIGEVKRNQSIGDTVISFGKVLCKPAVLIMVVHYACSLGTELAIDNVIGQVFREKFALDNSTSSYIGSVFGLLNICSRLVGGLFSDWLGKKWHMPGRILAHLVLMCLEGIFLIGFSFGLINLPTAIVLMIFFSFFVQAVCGSTFGIVPFVDPVNNGKVMGLVGAGGNIGGLVFNLMFRQLQPDFEMSFLILGIISLVAGVFGNAILRVQGKSIWHLFTGRYHS
ncbi:major facilitator superfamily domain-containing protein [Phascolomyces articulosus]|uniref:Nitrate/nitrite transporter n=1 Tax=Phascolomyces articulosus TaxID=60185 RepID=A0AAD5PEU7_9FUNG|nr:major facilitator superfamily domain-containing protein [Phascolomyces articulosus]